MNTRAQCAFISLRALALFACDPSSLIEGYVLPDGRRIAIVTQHVCGPQDIVILNSKN